MQPAITLRQKLASPAIVVGSLFSSPITLPLVETCIRAGLDYLILDGEHFAHPAERVADVCALGRLTGFPILYRPARTDPDSIRMALDLGPCGLLLPMIDSAAQLDEVAQGAHLPPRGHRRPGGPGNRWVSHFNYDSFKQTVEDPLILIPQIESPAGLSRAHEIAAHPLTTALGVGPFDLSARLNACGQYDHPDVRSAMVNLRAAADRAAKPAWAIGDLTQLIADGYRFLCIGDPLATLESALTAILRETRKSIA